MTHEPKMQPAHRDTDRKLEAGRRLAHEYSERPGMVGAYLSGSLVAGLGSATSDVDLFLVYGSDPSSSTAVQRQVDGVRVDVEVRTVDQLERLIEQLGRYRASLDGIDQLVTSLPTLDEAVRFLIGHDVAGAEALGRLRARLDPDELRKIIIGRHSNICVNLLTDVLGLLSDGEMRSALHVSRTLLLWALQAYLAGCGELYVADKWTWRKFARVGVARESIEAMWRLYDGGSSEGDLVLERIRLSQALLVAAMVDGWDQPSATSWSRWLSRGSGPRRALNRLPMRLADATYLTSSVTEHKVRVGLDGLRIWGLADGRPRDLIVEEMLDFLPGSADRGQVERYLDRLLELGVIEVSERLATVE